MKKMQENNKLQIPAKISQKLFDFCNKRGYNVKAFVCDAINTEIDFIEQFEKVIKEYSKRNKNLN